MKKLNLLIISILFFVPVTKAQTSSYEEANALYAEKEYTKAIEAYEHIVREEGIASEVFYNLGNAYFRINELGRAILNYERALRLNPTFKDAKHNLEFANQVIVDKLELADTFFLKKWLETFNNMLNSNTWFYISALLFVLTLILALMFFFGQTKALRKTSFYLGIVFFVCCVITLSFSFNKKSSMKNHAEAIVMTGSIVIKGSPDKSGTDLFQLHEGTKVEVISTLGDWYEIKLPNGNIGWVEIIHVEKI